MLQCCVVGASRLMATTRHRTTTRQDKQHCLLIGRKIEGKKKKEKGGKTLCSKTDKEMQIRMGQIEEKKPPQLSFSWYKSVQMN